MHVPRHGTVARLAKNGVTSTAVLTQAAMLISGIPRQALRMHTDFFNDRSVNRDTMLADPATVSADDHYRMAHTRQHTRQAAAVATTALYAGEDPWSRAFDVDLSAAHAPRARSDYMGAAVFAVAFTTGTQILAHVP